LNTDGEKRLQILANELTRANTHFYFGKKLHDNYQQLGSLGDFLDYTIAAHYSIALLNLCRVYDSHKDGNNLFNCLKLINKKVLSQSDQGQLETYIAACCPKSSNPLIKSLRVWRNNIIAHYNLSAALDRSGFDKNNPDEPEEMLTELIPHGFEILEWCSKLYGDNITYQRFAPGKESCDKVLNRLI
jgi:hypothetical protein